MGEYARPVSSSWRVDETYIRVKGKWTYLYRAVDKEGMTVDFLLSEKRDIAAAKRFFIKAIQNNEAPEKITLDGYEASHTAVSELKAEGVLPESVEVRTSRYLNNLVEQDHRRVKQRYYLMLGFKRFKNAVVTISGTSVSREDQEGAVRYNSGSPSRSTGRAGMGSSVGSMRCNPESTSSFGAL